MSSLLNIIREQQREAATGDVNFLKKMLYFFELALPAGSVPTAQTTFLFPLVINPNSIQRLEPFSVEPTMMQGAGFMVEENGIIYRNIRIRGNTGWKPRAMRGDTTQLMGSPPAGKSFSRSLSAVVTDAISGERHMQYLEDAVFRTYGDFKRDPTTAEDTLLIFHDPRLNEHWLVSPRSFQLEQSVSGGRTLLTYDIDLLVKDRAEATRFQVSEDKNLLDQIKNVVATIQQVLAYAQGAINDLVNLVDEIKQFVAAISTIIDNVTSIVNAATAFINGTVALIEEPFALVTSTAELIESSLNFYQTAVNAGTMFDGVPDPILQAVRQLQDACEIIGTHAQAQIRAYKASQQIAQANTAAALAAAAATPLTSLTQAANIGTALLPGDQSRAKAQLTTGSQTLNFTGSQTYSIAKGDTLASLAAQFLGDARLWQYIANLNGLKPPFVNLTQLAKNPTPEIALDGAVGVGTQILIPNYSSPPQQQPLLPILGVSPTASAAEQLLGADLLMAPVGTTQPGTVRSSRNLIDFVIDVSHGSMDLVKVRGIANLAQAMLTRTLTEKGTNVLYKNVGITPIVALNVTAIDAETAKYRLQESWLADPRVSAVRNLSVTQGQSPSSILATADIFVRGFYQATTVQLTVPTTTS
jgi:hypothetical protein